MQCRDCGLDKPKIKTNRKAGHSFIYVDAKGHRWSGKLCPSCYVGKTANLKEIQSTRTCRKCKKKLPTSRYFHHIDCEPGVIYYDIFGDYAYHG